MVEGGGPWRSGAQHTDLWDPVNQAVGTASVLSLPCLPHTLLWSRIHFVTRWHWKGMSSIPVSAEMVATQTPGAFNSQEGRLFLILIG